MRAVVLEAPGPPQRSGAWPRTVDRIVEVALSAAAEQSALTVTVAETFPLARIAAAHELIESGKAAGRVLVALP